MNSFSSLLMPSANSRFSTNDAILHVEDSEIDHESLKRSYKRTGIKAPLFWCSDIKKAQDFLSHQGIYLDETLAPRPAIILLDLNMPGEDGVHFLKQIKKSSKFSLIPVVVLSSSSSPKDVEQCYRLGANAYILKPMDAKNLDSIVMAFTYFWLRHTVLPPQSPGPSSFNDINPWSNE